MHCPKDRVDRWAGQFKAEAILKDSRTMPSMWAGVADEVTQVFMGPTGKECPGVAGGWPYSDLR